MRERDHRTRHDREPDPASDRPAPAVVPIIPADAVLDLDQVSAVLKLPKSCFLRDIRRGRLKASRRGKKYFVTGEWLHAWLRAGVKRRAAPTVNGQGPTDN